MKLLDSVRHTIRKRHYSIRTEQTYVEWIRRYIVFHGKRHPKDMGENEISQFVSYLATGRNVAASTQNQAISHFQMGTTLMLLSRAVSSSHVIIMPEGIDNSFIALFSPRSSLSNILLSDISQQT